MKATISRAIAAALACALVSGGLWAGETVTYKGAGTFVATRLVMPLASGGAAVHLSNDVVATIEPSDTGFMMGDCAGLGYISADGDYSVDAFCTFEVNATDAFDIRAMLNPEEGGEVEIIGGSGKWSGATGSGTIRPKYNEGVRGSYYYEFEITTP